MKKIQDYSSCIANKIKPSARPLSARKMIGNPKTSKMRQGNNGSCDKDMFTDNSQRLFPRISSNHETESREEEIAPNNTHNNGWLYLKKNKWNGIGKSKEKFRDKGVECGRPDFFLDRIGFRLFGNMDAESV